MLSTGPRWASLEEAVVRFREAGGEEAADVVRRAMESPSEQTFAEWRRVLGPLASVNPDPDPLIARLEAERIKTMDVNLHFTREGRAMDLRERLGAVRCPTLVILGEHDSTIPAHLGREIVEAAARTARVSHQASSLGCAVADCWKSDAPQAVHRRSIRSGNFGVLEPAAAWRTASPVWERK